MTELRRLAGVGSKTEEILRNAGYETAEEVLEADDEDLLSVKGIGRGLVMKMEITEERNLMALRIPRQWRRVLKEATDETEYTLSDALRVLLPDDLKESRMSIPEREYVSVYVEEDVHGDVNFLAGENVTALDVLEKYVEGISSEDLQEILDNEFGVEQNDD